MKYMVEKIVGFSQQKSMLTQHNPKLDLYILYFRHGLTTAQILSFSYSLNEKGYALTA